MFAHGICQDNEWRATFGEQLRCTDGGFEPGLVKFGLG
jgi:hypothetical protein